MRRQFTGSATVPQLIFDVLFGFVGPILCLVFDPFVFKGIGFGRGPLLGEVTLFAYSFIGLELVLLIVWLLARNSPGALAPLVAGALFAGAAFSSLLGLAMLPFTLIGILLVIGIFGFAPFFTAFVFARNAVRASKAGKEKGRALSVAASFGFILAFALPAAADRYVSHLANRSVEQVIIFAAGKIDYPEKAIAKLKRICWLCENKLDKIVWAYHNETDEKRKEQLAKVYFDITGDNIERRLNQLVD